MKKLITLMSVALVSPLSAGLVAHYTMDNDADFGENSGSATIGLNSISGIGATDGKFGGGAEFTVGSSVFWTNQFGSANTDLSQFSVSMHVRTTATANWKDYISFGTNNSVVFVFESNGASPQSVSLYNIGDVGGVASSAISGTPQINDGNWHHLGLTSDGANITFYIDGAAIGSTAYTGTGTITAFQLASRFGEGARAINSDIDDVAVYDEALSATQMEYLSNNVATVSAIPEPSSMTLLGISSLALILRRRR
ncbi:hypothetical protein Rhal01_01745 [Rubritalea halochordaticola]|uniref:LamG-like jellyroll fold domain-containing protein n=1 Tax=Rubritalea halochordaticola TaxID=714537 RepID=A0ABP9UYP8_9BACT